VPQIFSYNSNLIALIQKPSHKIEFGKQQKHRYAYPPADIHSFG